jgi:hypothetical protein
MVRLPRPVGGWHFTIQAGRRHLMEDSPLENLNYRTCAECSAEAGGRCPKCRHWLCPDHFSFPEHAPCAARQARDAAQRCCYRCGAPAMPMQWSLSLAAYHIDDARCHGCHRAICAWHTAKQVDSDAVIRDGPRGLRYHATRRYCHLCAPLHHWGGLIGITRGFVAVGTVIVSIAIALHH